MSGEFIKVNSIALSAVIRAELKRNGIIPQYTDVAGFQKFTREELEKMFSKKCVSFEELKKEVSSDED